MTATSAPRPWGGPHPDGDPGTQDFRDAMSRLAGGVGLLATRDPVGRDCAITVTAVTSVSLEPPMLLVCVKREGFIHDALYVSAGWTVTMLADDQVDLAEYAARHRHPGDRDDFSRWPSRRGVDGTMVVTGGVSAVECVPERFIDAGDHVVAIGLVVAVAADMTGERPLVYVDRAYRTTTQE